MKKLIYFIAPVILFAFAGCDDSNRVFEDNASARMQTAINEVNGILLGQPDGWILQYFPQTDDWGGFNMYMKFNDDKTADIRLLEDVYGIPEEKSTSSGEYDVKADQSVMLTFNTQNSALHYFVDRMNGLSLKADFEFMPKKWEKDYVLLQGKKYGFQADLKPLPAGETTESYAEKMRQSLENTEYAGYKLTVKDKTYEVLTDFIQRQIIYVEGLVLTHLPYIYTPDGIKFYEPVTLNGVEFSELTYDGIGKFTNAQGNVELEKYIPSNYDIFSNGLAWYFTESDGMMSDSFRAEWNKQVNTSSTPTYFYFCKDGNRSPELYTTTTWSLSGVVYIMELMLTYNPVEGHDNKVNMKYRYYSGNDTVYTNAKYSSIITTFFGLQSGGDPTDPEYKGRTYTITLDDPANPKTVTLTADDDPGYWFKLTVYKTTVK